MEFRMARMAQHDKIGHPFAPAPFIRPMVNVQQAAGIAKLASVARLPEFLISRVKPLFRYQIFALRHGLKGGDTFTCPTSLLIPLLPGFFGPNVQAPLTGSRDTLSSG